MPTYVDDTFTVTITAPPNTAPVANDDALATDEDIVGNGNVLANDTDIDAGPKTLASVTQPQNGTVVITGSGSGLTYQPQGNYCGSDSFTYTLNGGSTATVAMTVTCVNDEPTAVEDAATTDEDTPVNIPAADLLANDSAGPANESGQVLHIDAVSNSQNGQAVLNANGSVTFTPAQDFYGEASFDYTVCDNGGTANDGQNCFQGTAIVKVTVSPVNDAPVALSDPGNTTNEDTATNIRRLVR